MDAVIERASGVWVFDKEGRRYLDYLSSYSALNRGHSYPRILRVLRDQAERVTLTSRAFRNDQLPLFFKELAELCRMKTVLPMNIGAEAVETAIKASRRWGYLKKGIVADQAEIIICRNNFHGRTTTVTGLSSEQTIAPDLVFYSWLHFDSVRRRRRPRSNNPPEYLRLSI